MAMQLILGVSCGGYLLLIFSIVSKLICWSLKFSTAMETWSCVFVSKKKKGTRRKRKQIACMQIGVWFFKVFVCFSLDLISLHLLPSFPPNAA